MGREAEVAGEDGDQAQQEAEVRDVTPTSLNTDDHREDRQHAKVELGTHKVEAGLEFGAGDGWIYVVAAAAVPSIVEADVLLAVVRDGGIEPTP